MKRLVATLCLLGILAVCFALSAQVEPLPSAGGLMTKFMPPPSKRFCVSSPLDKHSLRCFDPVNSTSLFARRSSGDLGNHKAYQVQSMARSPAKA